MYIRVLGLALALLAPSLAAASQQPRSVHRIGYLANSAGIERREEAFRSRLRDVGYVEGQNLVIEWRFSRGRLDRLPDLAAELARLNMDCIIAVGVAPTRAAKQATSTIPIVMGNADDDPVRHGLVASLARPGGNVTGFTNIGSELAGKRLELLKEAFPKVSRVALLYDPRGAGATGHVRESESAAPALRMELQPLAVQSPEVLETTFQAAVKARAEALVVVHAGLLQTQRVRLVDLAARTRLPVMYTQSDFVPAGGLMSYDSDDEERYRGVATYVHKILTGTQPADLPVVRPTKFQFLVNLRTAKALGLMVPPSVLARADQVLQ
jgi:putative ABC transport system substrate-binding protein